MRDYEKNMNHELQAQATEIDYPLYGNCRTRKGDRGIAQ
jgi:hypothetical protein